jgi:hypothetical protein
MGTQSVTLDPEPFAIFDIVVFNKCAIEIRHTYISSLDNLSARGTSGTLSMGIPNIIMRIVLLSEQRPA